ncbi:hypothetical protein K438DRAFT_1821699 [Mycena galopus ATCC 62051]|nr:hypothetical protein K438DRAFT_1879469 [Mycena galopus ATCC 62051]KAF8201260.1 hypothetical protein K438DRAFT_1821699 [Mycena galopus ATCC 62051]
MALSVFLFFLPLWPSSTASNWIHLDVSFPFARGRTEGFVCAYAAFFWLLSWSLSRLPDASAWMYLNVFLPFMSGTCFVRSRFLGRTVSNRPDGGYHLCLYGLGSAPPLVVLVSFSCCQRVDILGCLSVCARELRLHSLCGADLGIHGQPCLP